MGVERDDLRARCRDRSCERLCDRGNVPCRGKRACAVRHDDPDRIRLRCDVVVDGSDEGAVERSRNEDRRRRPRDRCAGDEPCQLTGRGGGGSDGCGMHDAVRQRAAEDGRPLYRNHRHRRIGRRRARRRCRSPSRPRRVLPGCLPADTSSSPAASWRLTPAMNVVSEARWPSMRLAAIDTLFAALSSA